MCRQKESNLVLTDETAMKLVFRVRTIMRPTVNEMGEGKSWSRRRTTTTTVYCRKRDAKSLCYFSCVILTHTIMWVDNTSDQKIIRGSYVLKDKLLFLS